MIHGSFVIPESVSDLLLCWGPSVRMRGCGEEIERILRASLPDYDWRAQVAYSRRTRARRSAGGESAGFLGMHETTHGSTMMSGSRGAQRTAEEQRFRSKASSAIGPPEIR